MAALSDLSSWTSSFCRHARRRPGGLTRNIDENVPTTIPVNRAKLKLNRVLSPKSSRAIRTINVDRPVFIERDTVWLMALLTRSAHSASR